MTRTKLGIALALCALALPGPAIAKGPADLMLDPGSATALVILKTIAWQPAPSMRSGFRLTLSSYDPVEQKLLGKPYGGSVVFAAQEKQFVEGYLIERIKPGRWVFQGYSQQDKWTLCFNAASSQFEVKPGQIVYLGEFDAAGHRLQLIRETIRSGKVRLSGYSFADFFDLPEGPRFKPVDAAELAAVREMLARNAPKVTAPVVAADYRPAKFGTGSTLFAERRCGGYFSTGAKAKSGAQ